MIPSSAFQVTATVGGKTAARTVTRVYGTPQPRWTTGPTLDARATT